MRGRKHEQVGVVCPWADDQMIEIDTALAPLIAELWRLDIVTFQSCQEYWPGLASIEFPGTHQGMEFLDIAEENYKAELEQWDEGEHPQHCICLRLIVNFPTAAIPELVERFAAVERDEEGEFTPREELA